MQNAFEWTYNICFGDGTFLSEVCKLAKDAGEPDRRAVLRDLLFDCLRTNNEISQINKTYIYLVCISELLVGLKKEHKRDLQKQEVRQRKLINRWACANKEVEKHAAADGIALPKNLLRNLVVVLLRLKYL